MFRLATQRAKTFLVFDSRLIVVIKPGLEVNGGLISLMLSFCLKLNTKINMKDNTTNEF